MGNTNRMICHGYIDDSTDEHGIEYDPATSDAQEPNDYCSRKCELTVETFDHALTPLVPIDGGLPDRAMSMTAERMARQFHEINDRLRAEDGLLIMGDFDPTSAYGHRLIDTFREMLSGTIKSMFER